MGNCDNARPFTGQGILVATLDTGVAGNHPALAGKWAGLLPQYAGNPGWAWFDPVPPGTTSPQEFHSSSHGTHTMGTVLGGPIPTGGGGGDQIGVAPGAKYIHAPVIDRVNIATTVAHAIASFQWMANPTGDPSDTWAVPHVCSNSWGVTTGHGYPNCDQTFWSFLDNSEAAGTVQIFSAGNEGPGSDTLRRPADRARGRQMQVREVRMVARTPGRLRQVVSAIASSQVRLRRDGVVNDHDPPVRAHTERSEGAPHIIGDGDVTVDRQR